LGAGGSSGESTWPPTNAESSAIERRNGVADPAVIGRLKSAECDPTHWFLTERETTLGDFRSEKNAEVPLNQLFSQRSRGWSALLKNKAARDTLQKEYTSGNEVTPLIDGDAFMSDLDDKLSALAGSQGSDDLQALEDEDGSEGEDEPSGSGAQKPDDFILITGWEFWVNRTLSKRVAKRAIKESSNSLRNVLEAAVNEGAELRVLSFNNPIPVGVGPRTRDFVTAVNKFSKQSACLTEPKNPFMSHHQKEVFIGRKDFRNSYAYVGGMDLAIDRWDTTHHNQTEEEDRNFGWHDIQVRVRGEAALQLWANFAERWIDARNEMGDTHLRECPVPNWNWNEWKKQGKQPIGKQHVQVLRTIAIASTAENGRKRFMSSGERTVLCGLRKAISKAECYIYIEEQFLWDCDLADFIADQMKANPKLHLIIVMTAGCELPGPMGQYAFYLRHEFLKRVMRAPDIDAGKFGHTYRVYPYGLFQTKRGHSHEPIYVHSKLVIIDDRYVAVGSANFDSRSLYIETEVTLGIVDSETEKKSKLGGATAEVCKFAKKLREDLWKEHLGVANLGSDDPIEALKKFPGVDLEGWPSNASDAKAWERHHVRCYIDVPGDKDVPEGAKRLLDRGAREWKDPSGGVEHV
jgi:phosphatidylserine/phosphatidylglycerophosphate/cardiolipin synthase-like enzyme